jgi:hypothetical protein
VAHRSAPAVATFGADPASDPLTLPIWRRSNTYPSKEDHVRRILTSLVLVLGFSGILLSQSKPRFGVNIGVAIPTGDAKDAYKTGFQIGGIVRVPTTNPVIAFAGGAYVTFCTGKTVTETETWTESGPGWWSTTTATWTYKYDDAKPFTVFAGAQFGKEIGYYFLPAVTANFREDWTRFGMDIGAGCQVPVGEKDMKADFSAKYSVLNIIGKEKGEIAINGIRIIIGLNF